MYQKWLELIKIRNICNISIEEQRANKEIGSSLEADLNIHLDKKLEEITKNIDFSELCITSKAQIFLRKNLKQVRKLQKQREQSAPYVGKLVKMLVTELIVQKILNEHTQS